MEKTTKQLLVDLMAAGFSQQEISRKTKVSQATLSRIATGVNKTEYSRNHGVILSFYQEVMGNQKMNQVISA